MARPIEQALQYERPARSEARVTPRGPMEPITDASSSVLGAGEKKVRDTYTSGTQHYLNIPADARRPVKVRDDLPRLQQPAPSERTLQIPDLYCPFDPAVHPEAASVHAETVAWARAMGLARDDQHVQALHKAKVGWLVARAFPVAGQMAALQIAADWITLFCLIDTHIESIHGQALSLVYLKGLLNVFRDGAPPLIVDPYANALRDLRERMIAVNVPTWVTRFGEQLERLFGAYVDEAKYRQIAVVPEVAQYRKMREVSSGLYFGFRLGELTDNITLPPAVREHPTVRSLESKASLIVGLANDIYTVEKELAKGEVNNMVLVLMHEERISLEAAMMRAVEVHDAETREFIALARHLPSISPEVDVQLQRYVDVLSSMISGHRTWAIETARYVPRRNVARNDDT